jgi:16S rRNA (cytosine967-C5)-methyltransferase
MQPEPLLSADGLPARLAAIEILDMVLKRRRELSHALEGSAHFNALQVRDRTFTRMLISTVLRRLGQIEDIIRRAETKPDNAKPAALQNILRIGVAQILFMDVPDHAAVDTSVRLAEESGLRRLKGLVNGILRTVARQGGAWKAKQDETRLNIPHWLMEQWIRDYGLRRAAEIAQASLAEAPLDITLGNPAMAEYWAQALDATILPAGSLRRPGGGQVRDLPGYNEGTWWIQDAAAALPVRLLGDVQGRTVIDLCAAPGGKTAQLAAGGANVQAIDRSAARLRRLEENLKRLRLNDRVSVITADASVWKPGSAPDALVLDAPCTATGTIRRNPDILHHKNRQDMDRLSTLQSALLNNAASMLAPGGMLIYCTCALQKDEGEARIADFLSKNPSFSRQPIQPHEIGGIDDAITPEGDARLFPFHMAAHGGMDGFYMARLWKM